ncbi:UbiD family decarboxylase [Microbacterium sp.]|uniref:UbiD family decarboxylase n=1 Tax=Microbacterium sp. TaxID=51671 RepID=UPI0025CCBA53|nr:UbiD family decarboxylase [Microbacterium sp.]MBT9605868.1 UbiD family decarboxylase [Microbacterium sp.]
MPQQSLTEFVDAMEAAGLLVRVTDEKRVDELPQVMEDHPETAVLVEKITGCEFQFLANAYSNQDQYAWAMGCTKAETGQKMVAASEGRVKPVVVDTAPCKEVILTGDDVDLTVLPMFLHHERDGQSYTDDNLVISKDPETGVYDWGFYRSMYRAKNERAFDMTCTSHRARINAQKAAAMGKNLEIAVVIGGPILDKLAALKGFPPDVDDFEVLGSFYGEPAKLVKCETIDLMVPANAEVVLECELMATEGWVHDEAPFGEFTGMYGGGLKHNVRAIVKAITYRKGGIFQYATIGGHHPWFTDNMLQLPAMEADLFGALKNSALDVLEVRADPGGLSNIAYAKIRKQGAGDAKQALAVMLGASKMAIPKLAYVFDEDVDIWDDHQIKWAMAFRFDPVRDTVILPQMNTMTVDPMIAKNDPPATISKIGFDCTIPWGDQWTQSDFQRSAAYVLGEPEGEVTAMSEDEITTEMESFITAAPRSWKDILEHFRGQHYRDVYRAFSTLRPRLGRVVEPPFFPYTFNEGSDFVGELTPAPPARVDRLHHES